jgi:hypothetical protein
MTLLLDETWTQAAPVIHKATEKASIPSHEICSRSSLDNYTLFFFSFWIPAPAGSLYKFWLWIRCEG